MKQINFLLLLFVSTVVFYNCNSGPTPQELQRIQQAHDDSVRNAAIEERKAEEEKEAEKKRRAEEAKVARQKREEDKQILMQLLANLDADRQGEEARMSSVKSFQLLRTSSEKEAQIRAQAMRINQVKIKIEYVREQLRNLENGVEYNIPTR